LVHPLYFLSEAFAWFHLTFLPIAHIFSSAVFILQPLVTMFKILIPP
jgi:hypothetical protein